MTRKEASELKDFMDEKGIDVVLIECDLKYLIGGYKIEWLAYDKVVLDYVSSIREFLEHLAESRPELVAEFLLTKS